MRLSGVTRTKEDALLLGVAVSAAAIAIVSVRDAEPPHIGLWVATATAVALVLAALFRRLSTVSGLDGADIAAIRALPINVRPWEAGRTVVLLAPPAETAAFFRAISPRIAVASSVEETVELVAAHLESPASH